MNIFKFVLLLFACSTAYSQDLIVNPDYKGDICLYDSPGSKVIEGIEEGSKIKAIVFNDKPAGDFLMVTVKASKDEWLYGTIKYAVSGKAHTGWLKKADYLGVYIMNYDVNSGVELYTEPNSLSIPASRVGSDFNGFCTVKNITANWIYVAAKYNNSQVEGWLQPDKQCINPNTARN